MKPILKHGSYVLFHFVAFFHVASQLSTGVDNEKMGVDNEKALELDKRIHFSYFSLISISPQNATKYPVA